MFFLKVIYHEGKGEAEGKKEDDVEDIMQMKWGVAVGAVPR